VRAATGVAPSESARWQPPPARFVALCKAAYVGKRARKNSRIGATLAIQLPGGRSMEGGLEFRELTGLPNELVLALGEVTARYGQIEHILTMTIKRTAKPQISWDEAFEHVKKLNRKETRKKVTELFEQGAISEFGETEGARRSEQFNVLLEVWFDKDGGLADRRDDVVHSCWSIKEGHVTNTRKGKFLKVEGRPFGIKDVENLANNLKQFLFHLNRATMRESLSGPEEDIARFPPTYSQNYIVPTTLVSSSTAAAMPVFTPPVFPPMPSGE
jgi:hypothetical protein